MKRNLNFFLILSGLVLSRILYLKLFPVYDDAFITYRYAMNLVNYGRFTYNLDDMVLGTTTPLFGLVCSFFYLLGFQLHEIVPIANIFVDGLICWIVFKHFLSDQKNAGYIFVALFAVSPIVSRVSVGGMEADLFLLLSLCSFVLYQKERVIFSIVLASACFFIRPEAVIIVGTLLAFHLMKFKKIQTTFLLGLLALVLPLTGMAIFTYIYGQPLPQSVIAKSHLVRTPVVEILQQLVVPDPASFVLLPFALLGLYLCLRWRQNSVIVLAYSGFYLLGYVLGGPKIWSWYALPVQIGFLMCASIALQWIIQIIPVARQLMDRWAAPIVLGSIVLLLLVIYQIQPAEKITKEVYGKVREFCDDIEQRSATLLAGDIGILGYHCLSSKILDSAALVWPEGLKYSSTTEIIETLSPNYILIIATKNSVNAFERGAAGKKYDLERAFTTYDVDLVEFDSNTLKTEDGWTQEYLLYKKK